MTKPSIGLWIDDSVALLRKTAYWDDLKHHGVNTVGLMLESIGDGFNPRYTLADLSLIRGFALSRDIEIVLTVWPEPNKAYLDQLDSKIGEYLDAAGAAGLEFDAEGNWIHKQVKDFPNVDKAGDRLVEIFLAIKARHDVRTELTTFTMHVENSKNADIAPHCDRLLPQAYSVRNRSEGPVAWDHQYGPKAMQKLTLDRALSVRGVQTLSCGLAAYDQVWPGKRGEDAMKAAYEAALEYSPAEIRFWSSKWVLGAKKNGYASRFLLSLKEK